jgi:ABC-type Na+ efflux pump permease subunit
LPVAAREIRVAAHDRGVYRGRAIIAATALLITSWILYSLFEYAGQASSAVGQQIFLIQSWAAFLFSCGAFIATIDSISREKREGTLGLLFLTPLNGRDVILGKLISGLSLFVTGAFATLPILTLPLLLGGIQFIQCFHLLLSLLNTMLLSAAAGLFTSSICVKKQKSAPLAAMIVLAFCGFIPLVVLGLRKTSQLELAYTLQFFTPLFAQQLASGGMIGLEIGYYWTSLALVFSISLALLAAASFITPRSWQQKAKEPLLNRLTERYAAWTLRTIKSRSRLGRELLDRNAYEWLAARQYSAGTKAWTFIAAMMLLTAALTFNFTRHHEAAGVLISICIPVAYILQINLKVRVGGHAANRFADDRECNALELILCTPLSIRQMMCGEARALRRHFLPPIIAVTSLLFIGLALSLQGLDIISQLFITDGGKTFRGPAFLVVLGAVYFLALDTVTLAWAGMWCGLASRKFHKARGNTTALVLAAPFILLFGLFPLVMRNSFIRSVLHDAGFLLPFLLVLGFITLCNLIIIYWARKWLLGHARQRLTDPLIHARASGSFWGFFGARFDRKPPTNLRNGAKAAQLESVQSLRAD